MVIQVGVYFVAKSTDDKPLRGDKDSNQGLLFIEIFKLHDDDDGDDNDDDGRSENDKCVILGL